MVFSSFGSPLEHFGSFMEEFQNSTTQSNNDSVNDNDNDNVKSNTTPKSISFEGDEGDHIMTINYSDDVEQNPQFSPYSSEIENSKLLFNKCKKKGGCSIGKGKDIEIKNSLSYGELKTKAQGEKPLSFKIGGSQFSGMFVNYKDASDVSTDITDDPELEAEIKNSLKTTAVSVEGEASSPSTEEAEDGRSTTRVVEEEEEEEEDVEAEEEDVEAGDEDMDEDMDEDVDEDVDEEDNSSPTTGIKDEESPSTYKEPFVGNIEGFVGTNSNSLSNNINIKLVLKTVLFTCLFYLLFHKDTRKVLLNLIKLRKDQYIYLASGLFLMGFLMLNIIV